jgi:transposase
MMGRPSVDPELMIRMLIVGYCFGIRSERRLCEEVHLNLAYRWFCRLGLEGDVPDHSTFSKNRHGRFRESDLLRRVFETVVRRCIEEGLVGGEGFAVDGSLIRADANRQRGVEGDRWAAPEKSSRAVEEYLAVLDDAAFGAATPVTPKFVSPADPAARWTGANGGLAFFAYSANYLIDLDNAIIVDVEATTAIRQAEVTAAKRMIDRTKDCFDLYPARLAGDSGYGSAEMLGWLVHEKGIAPHVPVFDKSARKDGTFSREDFTYDHEGDVYHCPGGKMLTGKGTLVNDGATLLYRASKYDCDVCALKPRCCPKAPARKVPRSIYERARDVARDIAKTEEGLTSRRQRKKIEMLFAHLKRILRLDRLRLRGPNGARDEFLLAAIAQNLRKLAKLIPIPQPIPA